MYVIYVKALLVLCVKSNKLVFFHEPQAYFFKQFARLPFYFPDLFLIYFKDTLVLLVLRDCISNCFNEETKGVSFEKP